MELYGTKEEDSIFEALDNTYNTLLGGYIYC